MTLKLPDYWTPSPKPAENAFDILKKRLGRGQAGRVSRSTLNRTARAAAERQATVAAEGAVIPLVYGQARLGAMVFAAGKISNDLVLGLLWCQGEVSAVSSITPSDGITFTHYTGTAGQTADATLAAAISGYADNLPDLCYTVARIPPNTANGFPRFEAVIQGAEVYDPRTTTTAYSDNPALALADFLVRAGYTMDWTTVTTVADACDDTVGGEKRRTLGLSLDRAATVADWIETLGTYAGCFVVIDGSTVKLVADRPAAVSRTLTGADVVEGSLRLSRTSLQDVPTVVRVVYTDGDRDNSAVAYAAGVQAGTTPRRESVVRLPGITRHSHAYREAAERLNAASLSDLVAEWVTFDEGLADQAGDVVSLTHPVGLADKEFRVLGVESVEPGRWRIRAAEYVAGVYSDAVETGPSPPDTDLPDPANVPTVTGLVLTEEVYQTQSGIYAARIRATWTGIDYPYPFRYRVRTLNGSTLIQTQDVIDAEAATPAIQEGVTYTVTVQAVSLAGFTGTAAQDTIESQGKQLIPGDVPQVTATQTGAGEATVTWQEAVDLDIWGYEIRRGTVWASAEFVDETDSLRIVVTGLATGGQTFLVKAIDSIGQYSTNAASGAVTIQPPGNVTGLSGFEIGGQVRLSWNAATGYVSRYEVRRGPTTGFTWSGATVVDRLDAQRIVITDLAAGDYRFAVKAVDDAGHVSTTEATVDVTVTSDAEAFLADSVDFDAPTLTNMASWSHNSEGNSPVYYVTDHGDSIASLFPSAMSTYTDPLASYHASGTSEWLSETYDYGAELTGTWIATADTSTISGTVTTYLELSTDNLNWDQYSQLTQKATARYARIRIQALTTSTLLVTAPTVNIRITVVPREESGFSTSLASGAKTITLAQDYFSAVAITITPKGTASRQAVYDNIVTGDPTTFDVYIFDNTGAQVATDFNWTFKGV